MRKMLVMLLVFGLTACGGGGGSDGGLQYSVDRSPLEISFTQGDAILTPAVNVTVESAPDGDVYLGADFEGTGIDALGFAFNSDTSVSFPVTLTPDLAPGTYTGTISIRACRDENCNSEYAGSPLRVPYTITVLPGLRMNPAGLDLELQPATSHTQTVDVQLPLGSSDYDVSAIEGSGWITVQKLDSTHFQLGIKPLPPGSYNGRVDIAAGGRLTSMNVSVLVPENGTSYNGISVATDEIVLSTREMESSTPFQLAVTLPQWSNELETSISYTDAPEQAWLQVSRTAPGTLSIVGSGNGLLAGSYAAVLHVQGAYPSIAVDIPVTMVVGSGLLLPEQVVVQVNGDTQLADLSRAHAVTVSGAASFNWTAQSSVAWIKLDNASGAKAANLTYHIDMTALAGMTNGATQEGIVTVATSNPQISSKQIHVTLTKKLPNGWLLGPYVITEGRAQTLYVRGKYFDGAQSTVVIGGVTPISVSRTDDTQWVVKLPAMAAGQYSVTLSNGLGMTTSSPKLIVKASAPLPEASIPVSPNTRVAVYAPETDVIYTLDDESKVLTRFALSNNVWTSTHSEHIPGARNLAVYPGGNVLIVNRANGISLLSAEDLGGLGPVDFDRPLQTLGSPFDSMAITNDGRIWLQFSDGSPYSELGYFSMEEQDFIQVTGTGTDNISHFFGGGPRMVAPRDGSKLWLSTFDFQSKTLMLDPLFPYTISSPGVNRDANVLFSSISDDGTRRTSMPEGQSGPIKVYDETNALVGLLGVINSSAIVSHDGSRVFALGPLELDDTSLVFVYDSSQKLGDVALPLLGTFAKDCSAAEAPSLSLDDKTLIMVCDDKLSNRYLKIKAIPSVLSQIASARDRPSGKLKPARLGAKHR